MILLKLKNIKLDLLLFAFLVNIFYINFCFCKYNNKNNEKNKHLIKYLRNKKKFKLEALPLYITNEIQDTRNCATRREYLGVEDTDTRKYYGCDLCGGVKHMNIYPIEDKPSKLYEYMILLLNSMKPNGNWITDKIQRVYNRFL
jgi:hypothetical protein